MSSYKQGEVLAILYDIWLSGTKLEGDKKSCITSVEVKETVEGSDISTITVLDPEFRYLEDDLFLHDNTVKVVLGWSSSTDRIEFNGYISVIDIDFDTNGIPVLVLNCMDDTHIMNRTKKSNTYKNCTSADVVKKKCAEYGFTCVIDDSYDFEVKETITQSKQTDIDFITKLAGDEVYPFTARLIGKTFYYVKMGKLTTPKMELTYKKFPHEIISFSPRINKETKEVEIQSSSIDTGSKSVSTTRGTTNSSNGSTKSNVPEGNSTKDKSPSSDSASGGYTYNPQTKQWTKN